MKEIRDEGRASAATSIAICVWSTATLGLKNIQPERLALARGTRDWCRGGTHRIFNAGIKHYRTAGDRAMLRLYHEMSVIQAKDQAFEYFNCIVTRNFERLYRNRRRWHRTVLEAMGTAG
jgi:hypothetical protein